MSPSNGSSPVRDPSDGHQRIVDQLARLAAAEPGELERERLLDLIVDAIGVALVGTQTRVGTQLESLLHASEQPWDTALRLGASMHALDFDDTHEPSLCHTATALLPALLSLSHQRERSGADLLRAYDLGLRTVSFLSPLGPAVNEMGVHSTGTVGGLASAAACAWLLSEDAERAAEAMEIAAVLVSGLGVAFGTDCKPIQAGHAAEVGVRAAVLAECGVNAPRDALLGPRGLFPLWLGEATPAPRWGADGDGAVHEVAVKPYPSCFLTHGTIDNMLELRPSLEAAAPIQRIELVVSTMAATLADKTILASANDAKFSLRYCALAALRDGRVTLDTFNPAAQGRLAGEGDTWRRWADGFQVHAERSVPVTAAELRVHTADGRTLGTSTAAQRGSPGRPLTRDEIVAKFAANASACLDEAATRRLLDEIRALPGAVSVSRCPELGAACGLGALGSPPQPATAV
jgi:2-methylcitrate dehydratase PrpD